MAAARQVDSKGRLMLGEELAGSYVLVEKKKNGDLLVKPAVVIPANEMALQDNHRAYQSVKKGLAQAKQGKVKKSKVMDKVDSWVDELED